MTRWSLAARSASSRSWRSSLRTSRSPDPRVARRQVVAVPLDVAGEAPSSSPSRHTTRCGTDRMGTSVQTVRWPVQKLARVGRPLSRSARSDRTSSQLSSTGLTRLARSSPRRRARRAARSAAPAARRRGSTSRSSESAMRPGRRPSVDGACAGAGASSAARRRSHELGEAPGQVDVAAVDVVERQRAAEEALALVGHGHAEQDAVEPRLPGVGLDVRRAGTSPGARRRSPTGRTPRRPTPRGGRGRRRRSRTGGAPAHGRPGRAPRSR